MKELKGVVPVVACPFNNDGSVDYESFVAMLRHLGSIGCDGLTLFGIAGEYYKLTDAEQFKLIGLMVDECKRMGIPSVISITQHATHSAIERAKYVESQGADMLMLLPPFFLKPTSEDLYDHMKAVTKAVSIPVMLQYAPEQTGVALSPAIFRQLSEEVPNASYFKIECKPAGPYISSFLKLTNSKTRIFAGNAGYQMIETFDRGAIGVMPGCSMAELYIKIYNEYFNQNKEGAVKLHNALLPMLNHIRQNVEMIIYYEKKILVKRGIIASAHCRIPAFRPDDVMEDLFEMYYDSIKWYLEQ